MTEIGVSSELLPPTEDSVTISLISNVSRQRTPSCGGGPMFYLHFARAASEYDPAYGCCTWTMLTNVRF